MFTTGLVRFSVFLCNGGLPVGKNTFANDLHSRLKLSGLKRITLPEIYDEFGPRCVSATKKFVADKIRVNDRLTPERNQLRRFLSTYTETLVSWLLPLKTTCRF